MAHSSPPKMAPSPASNNPASPDPNSLTFYIAVSDKVEPDLKDSEPVDDISTDSRLAVRKLLIVSGVALTFMTMEFVGGYIASSLAVISDAVHMLTDVLGFAISLTAIWISTKSPSRHLTFGFHRVEIVGAVVSILVIWVLTGFLLSEAVDRFRVLANGDAPEIVDGFTMFIIALIGLVSNLVMMKVLGGHGHGHGHAHSHGVSMGHVHQDSHDQVHGHVHDNGHDHDHSVGCDHDHHNNNDNAHDHVHRHNSELSHAHDHDHDDAHSHEHEHDHNRGHDRGHDHGHDHDHDHDHGYSHGHGRNHCRGHSPTHSYDHGHDLDHSHGHDCDHEQESPTKSRVESTKFENLNIQAAYLHVLGDLLQSVGVTIAGALIWWKPSWQLADPIMTAVFSLLVICTTVPTMKQSVLLLMEGVPVGIDTEHIKKELGACDAVVAVHDLHIWSLSTSKPALAVHLVSDDHDAALASAQRYLIGRGITHSTIQVERPSAKYPQNCSEPCT